MKKNRQNTNQAPYQRIDPKSSGKSQKKKKKKAKTIVLSIVCAILVIGVAGAAYVYQLLNLVDRTEQTGDPNLAESDIFNPDETVDQPDSSSAIKEVDEEFEEISKIEVPSNQSVYNILLVGTDRRPGEKNGRSDAMIILSINQKTKKIGLTSLMRAMYVSIPGKGWSMLNASYSWGGPSLLLKTIENNFRLKIDDYMVVDFSSFEAAVNQVGGVEIHLTSAEAKYLNNTYGAGRFQAGTQTLNGDEALAYARIRKLDSDFERTGRQRNVIESLINKSRSLSLMELNGLAKKLLPLVNTNLSQVELLSLIANVFEARNYPVEQLMIPLEEHREMIYVRKMEMYRIDFKKTIETLHNFIYGS